MNNINRQADIIQLLLTTYIHAYEEPSKAYNQLVLLSTIGTRITLRIK